MSVNKLHRKSSVPVSPPWFRASSGQDHVVVAPAHVWYLQLRRRIRTPGVIQNPEPGCAIGILQTVRSSARCLIVPLLKATNRISSRCRPVRNVRQVDVNSFSARALASPQRWLSGHRDRRFNPLRLRRRAPRLFESKHGVPAIQRNIHLAPKKDFSRPFRPAAPMLPAKLEPRHPSASKPAVLSSPNGS